jgi:hypothetical protein
LTAVGGLVVVGIVVPECAIVPFMLARHARGG